MLTQTNTGSTHHYLSELDDDLTPISDIDLLQKHLQRQRRQLFAVVDKLVKCELAYERTVLRVDHENLARTYHRLSDEHGRLKSEYQHLGRACLYLINKAHDLMDERNRYYQEWQTNNALLTPRPDWDKAARVLDSGMARWKSLATGKSSAELMDVLIKEITDGNDMDLTEAKDYFEGVGEHSVILPFLRAPKYTRIVNRRIRRRMTTLLIQEIWADHIKEPQNRLMYGLVQSALSTDSALVSGIDSKSSPQNLADHVAAYFEKRFDSKDTAIEMGYNLRDACTRYQHSEEINLFWGIITGQIEEMVYHHRMRSVSQLLQHLMRMRKFYASHHDATVFKARKAIVSEPNSPLSIIANRRYSAVSLLSTKGHRETPLHETPLMTTTQFVDSLKLTYPDKTNAQIDELLLAAKHDLSYPADTIEFSLLFIEDDDGRFGHFLSTVIKQISEERIDYVDQIRQILVGYSLITTVQFTRAVAMVDPKIPQEELHRYIEWVFSVKNYSSQLSAKPLDLEDLLRRLENCACFKH